MLQVSGWQLRVPSNLTRFVLLALLSVSLMLLDARGHHLQKIRAGLTLLFAPIQLVAAIPIRVGGAVIHFIQGDETLRAEAGRLRSDSRSCSRACKNTRPSRQKTPTCVSCSAPVRWLRNGPWWRNFWK